MFVMLQLRFSSLPLVVLHPCSPWFVSENMLKESTLCHLNVQIIVKDKKSSDRNDYRIENYRFA